MPLIFHTLLPKNFPRQLNKNTNFRMEGVSDLAYELCYWVKIQANYIITAPGRLVQCKCDCFPWVFRTDGIRHQQ